MLIEPGGIVTVGRHFLACGDIEAGGVRAFLVRAAMPVMDVTYTDPPWGMNLLSGFRNQARKSSPNVIQSKADYATFFRKLAEALDSATARAHFVEMGMKDHKLLLEQFSLAKFQPIHSWNITYQKSRPCVLQLFSPPHRPGVPIPGLDGLELEGKDDSETPYLVAVWAKKNGFEKILDACTGKGLTGLCVDRAGLNFFGLELNPARLDVAIKRLSKQTGAPAHVLP